MSTIIKIEVTQQDINEGRATGPHSKCAVELAAARAFGQPAFCGYTVLTYQGAYGAYRLPEEARTFITAFEEAMKRRDKSALRPFAFKVQPD